MLLKRKRFERANTLSPVALYDSQVGRSFPKDLAVEIQKSARQVVFPDPVSIFLLFATIEHRAMWLVPPRASRVDQASLV